ncbi:hypothetical protein H0A36_30480, partial [Endozoicomonas sp. SM1973]
GNEIKSLDLSNNPMLENLQLTWNKLKLLDVSHNPKLRILLAAQNELGADRQSWLIFGVSVNHCLEIEDKLKRRGIQCGTIHGKTPLSARIQLIQSYTSGNLRCLISQGVLTTGFDAPRTDLLVLLRSTKSPGLYMQIMGRGLRISPATRRAQKNPLCFILAKRPNGHVSNLE